MAEQKTPRRVVSGMRPTGRLHLGHYHGAVKNWIEISKKAECFYFSADWHALTSEYKDTSKIAESQREMFADWIAAGLDPERCTLFIQSRIKQHAELFLLLGMISPLGWLERVPTYKEQQEQLKDKDLNTFGFLGYPVLQTADVALYGADAVPVGPDQVSHLGGGRGDGPPLGGGPGAGGPGPGLAPGGGARDRAQVQPSLLAAQAGPGRAPRLSDRRAEDPRAGRPQDEQELRQRHRDGRGCGERAQADHGGRHRSRAEAPARSRASGGLPHLLVAPRLQPAGDGGPGRPRMPQ